LRREVNFDEKLKEEITQAQKYKKWVLWWINRLSPNDDGDRKAILGITDFIEENIRKRNILLKMFLRRQGGSRKMNRLVKALWKIQPIDAKEFES
jgi:hypothetical protein